MSGHTPGPWTWRDTLLWNGSADGVVLQQSGVGDVTPEDKALVSAAPELLAALKVCHDWACSDVCSSDHKDWCVAASLAISKAEGKAEVA